MSEERQSNTLYIYLPYDVPYTENATKRLKAMFKTDKVEIIVGVPYDKPIRNSIVWINSHGLKRTDKHDFMIEVSKVKNDYMYLLYLQNRKYYIESSDFEKFFDIKDSIIIFDACYSSEICIRTLGNWKTNLIFTCGYIPEYYNEESSNLINLLVIIYKRLKQKYPCLSNLNYEILLKEKDFINEICTEINKDISTQFSLF